MEERYAVAVTPSAGNVHWLDLGPAPRVDDVVLRCQRALRGRGEAAPMLREAYQTCLAPALASANCNALVLGNPAYGQAQGAVSASDWGMRALRFSDLPGAAQECQELARLLRATRSSFCWGPRPPKVACAGWRGRSCWSSKDR